MESLRGYRSRALCISIELPNKNNNCSEHSPTSDSSSAGEEVAKLAKMLAIDEKESSEMPQPSKCEMASIDVENMSENELSDAMSAACSSLAGVVAKCTICL